MRTLIHPGPISGVHVSSIAILVLTTTSWPRLRQVTGEIEAVVAAITAADDLEFPIA